MSLNSVFRIISANYFIVFNTIGNKIGNKASGVPGEQLLKENCISLT